MKIDFQTIKIKNQDVLYYSAELDCAIKGSIIDIETTTLKPQLGIITGLGIVDFGKLSCFVPLNPDNEDIQEWMKDKASRTSMPRAAYYNNFETDWLDIEFDVELQPVPYQKKDESIENYYGYKPAAIQIPHLGKLSPNSEMPYASPKEIIVHLVQDMFLELALYVTGSSLYRRYYGKWDFIADKIHKEESK